ncbi:MAG: oxidoreductase [Nocardioidaceae bacterium]
MRRHGALTLSLVSLLGAAALAAAPAASAGGGHAGSGDPGQGRGGLAWRESVVDADQSFRGLDAVDRRTAWVTGGSATEGAPGRVFRTTDGGRSWADVTPPGTDGLLLRDVEASGRHTALVLAIGPGEDSRIFRTSDGGRTWAEAFVNDDPNAFYDCMAMYGDGRHGLAMSDPVDGKFRILATRDGGRSWAVLPNDGMPDTSTEYGFAASGDCLVTVGRSAYFGSGGGLARVFRSDDFGLTWTASDSTIPPGEAAGVFALAFQSRSFGVAVGGDFSDPADGVDAVAVSVGGHAWTSVGDPAHLAEDAAFLPGRHGALLVTGESGDVGGTSISADRGRTWTQLSPTGYHALDCTADGSCWGAGSGGRVASVSRR